jgi:hypothetical protein
VNSAITEVDVLLTVAERERHGVADVARIGGARGISSSESVGHRLVADHARGVAVADRLKFPVPALERQPNFRPLMSESGVGTMVSSTRQNARGAKNGSRFGATAWAVVTVAADSGNATETLARVVHTSFADSSVAGESVARHDQQREEDRRRSEADTSPRSDKGTAKIHKRLDLMPKAVEEFD